MVIYMYLAILIVTSILTGIIVTIIERKGFYPKPMKVEKKKKNKKKKKEVEKKEKLEVYEEDDSFAAEPVITSAVTVFDMKPIEEHLQSVVVDQYEEPVLISSYTVDLSGVINHIQKIDVKDEIEILDEDTSMSQSEGLV